ncbi:MAG TPA: DUF5666 domain-containing protein [Anaerolineales bacterium]|nr:DUF5666 domain-containing protein [Anaerolineales bacterium]
MKIHRALLFLLVGLALLFASAQVLAGSAHIPNAQKMPSTGTPGAKATERAEDKATKQAEKVEDKATKQANKEDKPKGKHEHFKGTVAAVDSASLTLTLRDGSSVTIGLTAETRIKFPGPKNSTPESIEVGMTVNVQAIRDENGNLLARMVMVVPGKPSKIHRVGIVTDYAPGSSITIQDKDGNTFAFTITSEVKLLPQERAGELAVGSRVTIIAPRDPATGGVRVIGIVIHPAKP